MELELSLNELELELELKFSIGTGIGIELELNFLMETGIGLGIDISKLTAALPLLHVQVYSGKFDRADITHHVTSLGQARELQGKGWDILSRACL